MSSLLALLALAPALAHAPPAGGVHHTAVGRAAARHMLLAPRALGPGWTAGAVPKRVGLACGAAPAVAGAVETGSAVAPTLRAGPSGPFVSQAAFVYASAGGALRTWRHVSGRSALACLAASVAGGSTRTVRFTVVRRQPLGAPHVAGRSAAYRVVAHALTSGQEVTAYVDVVLLQRGGAISEISVSSFLQPPDPGLELRVARAVSRRL